MNKHLKSVHDNEKEVKCELYELTFKRNKQMLNHKRVHNIKVFKCDVVNCKYLTKNTSNLAKHNNYVHCIKTDREKITLQSYI